MTVTSTSAPGPDARPRAGTPAYRRTVIALVAAAVATFAQLWSVQPILPAVAHGFDTTAAQAALTVSLATGGMAGFTLVWSGLADRLGRARVITLSLLLATLLGCFAPFAGDLVWLLVLRTLQGAALGGVPAAAVAYLSEEIHPTDVPRATGLYIAGNPLGGMGGRLLAGMAAEYGGWQWGVAANTLLGLAALAVFVLVLPRPHARASSSRPGAGVGEGMGPRLRSALTTRGLLPLYAQALLLMGAFMTVYNLLGFRLMDEPFGLSQAVASLLFLAYTAGMVGSTAAGSMTVRWGGYTVLTLAHVLMVASLASLSAPYLAAVIPALLVLTYAFFSAHATSSAWVGTRAVHGRTQAMAIYTLCYYLGSSLFGWMGGLVYDAVGWNGSLAFAAALTTLAGLIALRLRRLPGGPATPP
ncbi:MFS transporter [Nocardiopsis salina]|uniref:MFS transporter n=1 Tax=Nocardiopsis salina TaxID=245836 RepID=UPI00037E293C|nr:MFS transporter [Nocardiopsis salina]